MVIRNALAGVAARDADASISWYGRLLGRPPDSAPMPQVAEWRFEGGGWLQVFSDPTRAGSSSVTLAVSDLDAALLELAELGVEAFDITHSEIVRTATVRDPDGNRLVYAEALSDAIAR